MINITLLNAKEKKIDQLLSKMGKNGIVDLSEKKKD